MPEDLNRTTYMFSATMPLAIEKLARNYLRNPVMVSVGTIGKAVELVTQNVVLITESEKFGKLKRLLDEFGDQKIGIVFVNTKNNVETVAKKLDNANYRATTLHSGKS
ncbi:P-loop containing nucleoside triphosphate hydrolase [Trema orientale]|uniref:P-loop containing nucleoside triphosphate hydrolase n=1 Tax=Trema orientale TaxID=63057 RepID=A0A2P5F2F3_TREOI|nr:P-loop containing nucleoside triphosphate hydrolase [Trema orientale]